MAEAHPVGFQWVMEAKKRGAKVIHVDPRFTRTSAVADLHVPIRAGADIAFVGGLINYVLTNDKYFREYVLAYTNAATILAEDFADTEDLEGVFSGLDREHRVYHWQTWQYQGKRVRPAVGERSPEAISGEYPPARLRQLRRAAPQREARVWRRRRSPHPRPG
jgi:formate dehydrogenase major subunit